jgi:putative FmdB family regulatory protein
MPLYEYLCGECNRESELLVNSSQEPTCPECGSLRLTKLLSVVAAPSRNGSAAAQRDLPQGPCGSSCACFPSNG